MRRIESCREWLTAKCVPTIRVASNDAQGPVAVRGDDERGPRSLHRGRKLGIPDRIVTSLARHVLTAQERVENGGRLLEPLGPFPWRPVTLTECAIRVRRTARAESHRDTAVGNLVEGGDLRRQQRRVTK